MGDAIVNDWVQHVRWARLDTVTYAVALTLASYADPDGSNVYPGTARVALDARVSVPTVKRALATLRKVRLIEPAGRMPGSQVTKYRLVPPDLVELRRHVEVPDPDDYGERVKALNKERRRNDWRARKARNACGSRLSRTNQCAAHADTNVRLTSDGVPTRDPPAIDPPEPQRDLSNPVADRNARANATNALEIEAMNDPTTTAGTQAERDRQTAALADWQRRQKAGTTDE